MSKQKSPAAAQRSNMREIPVCIIGQPEGYQHGIMG